MSTTPPTPFRRNGAGAPRAFSAGGRTWVAALAGDTLGGNGRLGTARLALVHFFAEGADRPSFETLIAADRFDALYDTELAALLARARPIRP